MVVRAVWLPIAIVCLRGSQSRSGARRRGRPYADVTPEIDLTAPRVRPAVVGNVVTAHVIGLTGGIASGKTTVAALLTNRGAAVVDADRLARHIVEPGQPALGELIARFGAAILTADRQLDRKQLAAI